MAWKKDEAFAQRRLAGQCPFSLRKVIKSGQNGLRLDKLLEIMNPKAKKAFKFDKVCKNITILCYHGNSINFFSFRLLAYLSFKQNPNNSEN